MRHAVKLAGRSCTACSGPLWGQRYSQAARLHAAEITEPALCVNCQHLKCFGAAVFGSGEVQCDSGCCLTTLALHLSHPGTLSCWQAAARRRVTKSGGSSSCMPVCS